MSSLLPSVKTPEERRELWKQIHATGSIENYVNQCIREQGLYTGDANVASMNKKEKAQYKEKKRQESSTRKQLRKCAWLAYRETHIVHLGEGVFHNDLVDADKFDLEKRDQRLENHDLPKIENVDQLSEFFDVSIPQLRWLAYHKNADTGSHYKRFTIPKADGSERIISAPKPLLKACQRKIHQEILEKLPVHGAAHGFVAGRSIATHADVHAGAEVIIKLDIRHFFPTIVQQRVKGLFRKMGYQEQVATLFAQICTEAPRKEVEHDGTTFHVAMGPRSLPQGAPTSPTITNLICLRLDRRLTGLARKYGWRYSRYADDLAFSWHQSDPAPIGTLLNFGKKIIADEGFTVHPEKERVLRSKSRQILTGLVVNKVPHTDARARVPRKTVRQVRAAIYNHQKGRPTKAGETLEQLLGMAAFINQSDPKRGGAFIEQIKELIRLRDQDEI